MSQRPWPTKLGSGIWCHTIERVENDKRTLEITAIIQHGKISRARETVWKGDEYKRAEMRNTSVEGNKGMGKREWPLHSCHPCPVIINDLWLEGQQYIVCLPAKASTMFWDNLHSGAVFFTKQALTRTALHHEIDHPHPLVWVCTHSQIALIHCCIQHSAK